jgi:hypothetical protein
LRLVTRLLPAPLSPRSCRSRPGPIHQNCF